MAFTPPAVDEIEEQPKFTPPAPDEIDSDANKPAIDISRIGGHRPRISPDLIDPVQAYHDQQRYRMLKAGMRVPDEPDGPFTTAMRKAVEPVAAGLINAVIKKPPVFTLDFRPEDQANVPPLEMGGNRPSVQPNQQMVEFPPNAFTGEVPDVQKMAGGFTTPGQAMMIPFAEAKPVQALFAGQIAESIPEQLKTPEGRRGLATLGAAAAFGKLLSLKGDPNALYNEETAALHGDVRKQPGQGQGQVPAQEGGAGVQPPGAQEAKVSLSDQIAALEADPDVTGKEFVGMDANGKPEYQGRIIDKVKVHRLENLKAMQEQGNLESGPRGEYYDLLKPHWDDDRHQFGKLPEGSFMMADHGSGKVIVDPEQFGKYVDEDLKGMSAKQKAKAVESKFDHEEIHLKTDPEDAEPFWNSLSPFEQAVLKRQYLKGNDASKFTPAQLGFEAIRNRIERAMGLTRDDFVEMALTERWSAQALDHLSDIVGKIRRFRDKELSAHQKDILDKVQDNIGAARNAVVAPTKPTEKQEASVPVMVTRAMEQQLKDAGYNQEAIDAMTPEQANKNISEAGKYTEGPFALRQEDEPGGEVPPFLKKEPGETTVSEFMNLSDEDVQKFFDGNIKRHNPIQNDSVLAGMKMGVDKIPELTQMRDQMHKLAMKKLEESFSAGGTGKTPIEMGKVIWLNGALEGAARKGPNYEAVTTRMREQQGPAALRKKGKPGEQEEMFGAVTARGVPGGEDVQAASAAQLGAKETVPEQKVFPKEIAFEPKAYGAESLPYRAITASEGKSERELGKLLTRDARKGGSELPVSFTRRLTVLFDKRDGTVHMVSTYPVARPRNLEPFYGPRLSGQIESRLPEQSPIAYMVDPALAGKERPNRPVEELLPNYQPIASVLLREPKQNFHQKFNSMADFQSMFGNEAQELNREQSTGTEGIPQTNMAQEPIREPGSSGSRRGEPSEPFRMPKEKREPNFPRPEESELKAFHDFFGDTIPSDANMFSRAIEKGAANASRGMINAIRKMVRIERAQTRSLSEGEAIGRVLDKLYENIQNSDTRSDFVKRTLDQIRVGAPEEVPAGGTPRATGARELSTLRERAPTTVAGQQLGKGSPEPPHPAPQIPPEMLTAEEQKALAEEIRKGHPPQFEVSPRTTLGKQLLETKVPQEPYTVGKPRTISKVEYYDPDTGETYEVPYQGGEVKTEEELEAEDEKLREENKKQLELYPERQVMTEKPEAAKPQPKESLKQEKKVVEKGEGNKGQLDFFKKQGPAALRKAKDAADKLKDYLRVTGQNVSTAGELSDQLYRLKSSEKADYDLALPVIKSALKIIPEGDRANIFHYADQMQVLGKSDIKLNDAQQMMYETFIDPLVKDNQRMYEYLKRSGVPVGENTYFSRMVQDTHSLYSRLWRGTKQRITEGSILGQGASFFKRRVFKAIEDEDGNRQLVALVGSGDKTKVISYENGKAKLMGDMPNNSMKAGKPTASQRRAQSMVTTARAQETLKLNKEQDRLDAQLNDVMQRPEGPGKQEAMDAAQKRIDDHQLKYVNLEEKYPTPLFDTPRFWTDQSGKKWHLTDATVGEVEGNTNTRYYKEPMSGIITQNLKLKQIYRATKFLENLKDSPDFQRVSRSTNERNVPADWRTVDLPQFRGLRFEPRTAEVLDLFAQEQKGPSLPMKYVTHLVDFLKNSLFVWNPLVHEPNLLTHWFTARGLEWAKPMGYDRMLKSGVAAFNDVLTRSRFRDEAMRAGAPLLRGMGDINRQLMRSLQKELDPNPSLATKVARGLGMINPLRMIRSFGDSLTWGTNEVLTLQLIRETMARTGLSLDEAVTEVGKHMPNYRVPPRVLNSRLLSHVMRNPLLTLWGHYHYGAFRSYGEMAKEVFSPKSTLEERAEGLGRVATVGFLMAVAYPVIDDLVNKVLHTKGLKMRRAGSATAPQNLMELMQHKKTPEAVLQSVLTPSPVTQGAFELAFNRNLRTGLPVYERRLGTQTLKDLGSFAAGKVSPIEEGGKVLGGKKSAEEFGLGLAGITRTRADSAMSKFGRVADDWMRNNPDESIREQYKRRTQDVFAESDYQLLRSAVIRGDARAGEMMIQKLLKTRKPEEVAERIQQWKNSPFTGTRKTDKAFIKQMTPEELDLWYQAAQERLDIADGMMNHLVDHLAKSQ